MGLFEENPLLLLPFLLVVMIGYDVAKWAILRMLRERQRQRRET